MGQDSKFKRWLQEKMENAGLEVEGSRQFGELIDAVDSWVVEGSRHFLFAFKETLLMVLIRIPDEDVDYLINGRIISFVIPYNGILAVRALTPGHLLCVDPCWYARATNEEALYGLAHELAHVFLDHPPGFTEEKVELETDQLVIKWGFEDELRACPYNYLYGIGLDGLRWKDE